MNPRQMFFAVSVAVLLVGKASMANPPAAEFQVNWTAPVVVRFRNHDSQAAWTVANQQQSNAVVFQVPAGCKSLDIELLEPGLFLNTKVLLEDWPSHRSPLDPSPTFARQKTPTGLVFALILGGLAGTAGLIRSRFKHNVEELEDRAEENRGYFPTDGSLPTRIGQYAVQSRLGSGGMAVVYKCLDRNKKPVAVKVPLPNIVEDDEFVRRFNREMKLGVELQHPRLCQIYSFQPAGGNVYPFLVMEVLEGEPLDQIQFPVDVAKALDWTVQVLDVLEFVHGKGVVHRDLKPSNLFLTAKGIKVTDLGIAYNRGTVGDRATKSGTILGTPAYIDPIMFTAGTADDPRSDLYATGVILYEMLTGGLPYPEEVVKVISMKISKPFPALTEVRPDLPEVSEFIAKITQTDPERRYDSASSALVALRSIRAKFG